MKQSTFDDKLSPSVKIEKLTRDDPWLSSCEDFQDCKELLEKQQEKRERLLKEVTFTHRKTITHERHCKNDSPEEKAGLNSSFLSSQMIPIRNHFHKHASHVKKLHYNSMVNTHQMITNSEKLCEHNELGNLPQSIHFFQFTRTQTEEKSYGFSDSIQPFNHGTPLTYTRKYMHKEDPLILRNVGKF